MECLRKGEEKSENRRSIIVEAGALAVAANVEHLSLTSKNNIASIEQVRCEEFPSSKITNMTSPVYIQDKWNRSFVLMILLATSGLVVWNGVKWTAKTRKVDKCGQVTESPNQVEECGQYNSFLKELKGLELEGRNWHQDFERWDKKYSKKYSEKTDNVEKMTTLQEWIMWMLDSFKNIRKNVEKLKSSFQAWFFVWSLEAIDEVVNLVIEVDKAWTSDKEVDEAWTYVVAEIKDAISVYMVGFVNESPKFWSDCRPALKSRYDSIMSSLTGKYLQLKQENE